MSILVIGDENTVLGFSLVGIEGTVVHSLKEARSVLDEALQDRELALVLVTADWALQMRDRVNELVMTTVQPLVVEIPGGRASTSSPPIAEMVREAVGVQLDMGRGR